MKAHFNTKENTEKSTGTPYNLNPWLVNPTTDKLSNKHEKHITYINLRKLTFFQNNLLHVPCKKYYKIKLDRFNTVYKN